LPFFNEGQEEPKERDVENLLEAHMRTLDDQVLKVTKEMVAKFIEVGRVSPTSFDETFKSVYRSVKEAILGHGEGLLERDDEEER
jgi:hypothetical protein